MNVMNNAANEHIAFLRGLMERIPMDERGSQKAKSLALEVRRLESHSKNISYPQTGKNYQHDIHK